MLMSLWRMAEARQRQWAGMLVILFIAGANYRTRNRLKEKGFFFSSQFEGIPPMMAGKYWHLGGVRQLVILYVQEGSRGQTGNGA